MWNVQNPAYSLETLSLELIARDLLLRKPGERIPTIAEYQARFGVGSGTVQARLRTLQSIGAIRLRPRGHRGTILEQRLFSELWSLSRMGPARGILPLPEAFEPVALAAVLRREFQSLGVPLELLYLHGASKRIQLVRDGEADFAVASEPAAQVATALDSERWALHAFGPETYNTDGSMVVLVRPRLGADDRLARIGIDPDSHDHALLTRAEFPEVEGYSYAASPHARLPALVASGEVDAAVWHRTTLAIPLALVGVGVRPLHQPRAIELRKQLGHAVIVAQADRAEIGGLFTNVDLSRTRLVQDEIQRSEVLPLY